MLEPKEEIKTKLDVADVISEYIQLKPAGSGAFKGLCPFHSERTPSFHVSRERQIWHCFGCDKGGDMFAFVMEMEGMSFPEAMRHLARKAGVEVPEFKPVPKQITDAREALLAMNDLAQRWYAKLLKDHPEGQVARDYLAKRGIASDLAEKFGLGYAPDRWDALTKFLATRGFTPKQISESGFGLTKRSGDGQLDRFRHRLMIPLCDAVGNVVGFTGRTISPGQTVTPEAPKYMNSPESLIYKKGEVLYGLHLAKTGIRTAKSVIIVEGNLDVVASHKAGVENIVASSGTALTEAQLRILSRYTKNLVFALDGDAAGVAAAKRVFDLAMKLQNDPAHKLDVSVRCLIIPEDAGKDPDEVVQKDPELWQKISAESREIVEFYFDHTLRAFEARGSATVEDRKTLIGELIAEVARLKRADERHLYILRISDATHVDVAVLEKMIAENKAPDAKPQTPISRPQARPQAKKLSKEERAAEFLLGLMLVEERIIPELVERLATEALPNDPWGRLYSLALELYHAPQIEAGATQHSLFSRLRTECLSRGAVDDLTTIDAALLRCEELVNALPPKAMRVELDRHIAIFEHATHASRRRRLESAIREAELSGARDTLAELLEEYARLLGKTSER